MERQSGVKGTKSPTYLRENRCREVDLGQCQIRGLQLVGNFVTKLVCWQGYEKQDLLHVSGGSVNEISSGLDGRMGSGVLFVSVIYFVQEEVDGREKGIHGVQSWFQFVEEVYDIQYSIDYPNLLERGPVWIIDISDNSS